jgi:hypothetical protein
MSANESVEIFSDWLGRTRFSSLFSPYHYYNEGILYALIGAVFAMRVIAS